MAAYETIVYEKTEHAAIIAFNRPQARNTIVPQLLSEFLEAVQDAAADKSLRVLVLRGVGRDFCAGADVKAFAAGGRPGGKDPKLYTAGVILHECQLVTIAAIRGACAGAGLSWASACDMRICDASAKFNTAFLDVGLSGDMGGTWLLSRILGPAKARELYFLPGKFDAEEALRIGLVNRALPEADFEAAVSALSDRLVNSSPVALKGIKANFVDSERLGLADFITAETGRHAVASGSEDCREAFRAFVEKRRPVFQGR